MKRQVFFSFEYNKDVQRVAQVREMGVVSGDSTFSDNDWEKVKLGTDAAIRNWIDDQMDMRSCVVVLVGESTASRPWVKYEIKRAYELGKGIVGVRIHGLKNLAGEQSAAGPNPFDFVYTSGLEPLSRYVTCYDPPYQRSRNVYADISNNLELLIEDALANKPPR